MSVVQTLRGPIDSSEMGYTLSHEHLFPCDEGLLMNYPGVWDKDKIIEIARKKLTEVYESGVRTIVDAGVLGNGRNIELSMEVAKDLPINIIMCTGVFYRDELPGFFASQDAKVMARLFVNDIVNGISGTNVKAAIVKGVSDYQGITFGVEKALRAVAMAHIETGAVLHTHAHALTEQGLKQQKIFKDLGVDLSKVYIGHCINSVDMNYLKAVLDEGSFIGYDRWAAGPLPPVPGMPTHPPVTREKAVKCLAELCRQGYTDQILIGNDACSWQFMVRLETEEKSPDLYTNSYMIFNNEIIPMLLAEGVTEEQIHMMTVDNPRRLFELNAR